MDSPHSDDQLAAKDRHQTTASPANAGATDNPLAIVGYALGLGFLSILNVTGIDRDWRSENALLMVFLTVVGAWTCPRRPILVLTLIALATESLAEFRQTSDGVVGCFIRFAGRATLNSLLILWTSRVRQNLERAQRSARIDSLTGLPNRQAILDALESELCRARRFRRPFSVAMLDGDGFKAINDQHGHLAGDRALQQIAAALRKQTRAYDHLGRFGGDEFVLILSEADVAEIPAVFERLRTALQNELNSEYPSLTFSIGVVTIRADRDLPSRPFDLFECLRQADEAMYVAKRSGRGQTCFQTYRDRSPDSA